MEHGQIGGWMRAFPLDRNRTVSLVRLCPLKVVMGNQMGVIFMTTVRF